MLTLRHLPCLLLASLTVLACDPEVSDAGGSGGQGAQGGQQAQNGSGGAGGLGEGGGDGCFTLPQGEFLEEQVGCNTDCPCTAFQCQSTFAPTPCAWDCQLDKPCKDLTLTPEPMSAFEIDNYNCLIAELEAGTEGTYNINFFYTYPTGQYGDRDTLFVMPERQVLLNQTTLYDLSFFVTSRGPLQLNTPAFFQQCASAADDDARTVCVEQLLGAYVCQ